MSLFDWLLGRKPEPPSVPLFSPEEVKEREELHRRWEEDYRERQRRAYELEQRANWLTTRLFSPAQDDEPGKERRHGGR